MCFQISILIYLGKYPVVELVDNMVTYLIRIKSRTQRQSHFSRLYSIPNSLSKYFGMQGNENYIRLKTLIKNKVNTL